MKNTIILTLIFQSALIQSAAVATDNTNQPQIAFCKKEVTVALKSLSNEKKNWSHEIAAVGAPSSYARPSKKFGQWVELFLDNNLVSLKVSTRDRYLITTWQKGKCKNPKQDRGLVKNITSGSQKDIFTDSELSSLIKKHKRVMIYVWSPQMIYSVNEAQVFKRVARKAGLKFISVMNPLQNTTLANKILQKKSVKLSTKKLASHELLMRKVTNHYPTTLIIKNEDFVESPIIGAYTQDKLEKAVAVRLAQ